MTLKNIKFFSLVLLIIFSLLFLKVSLSFAEDAVCTKVAECSAQGLSCSKCVDYLNAKIGEVRGKAKTLASEISVMDSQIQLTEARIKATEQQIEELQEDIGITKKKVLGLESDISSSTKALLGRIAAVYEIGRAAPWQIFLTSDNISSFMTRLKYLKIVQIYDKRKVYAAEQSKVNYENQQEILEEKEAEAEALNEQLERYTDQLDADRQGKQRLLTETQGSEARYQRLLAQARAEYEAIVGIIAGRGTETEIREVKKGDAIASVIPGASCNSSGGHLHFIVQEGGSVNNPFSYLRSVESDNCSGSSCGSGDGDQFNPGGSWDWPLSPKITMNQGYGETWAVRNTWVGRIYRFHNGIDIVGSSSTAYAVTDGTLYRGSYSVGCALPYIRVKHKDSNIETLYLHVYSN